MRYSVIEVRGLEAFATLIITLYESLGSVSKVKSFINNNPETLKDVLFQGSKEIKLTSDSKDFPWDKKIIKKLDLTDYQVLILNTILNKKNVATLSQLEIEFKNKQIDISTGSVIGGSLAGITKKCHREKVPNLILKDKKDKYKYKLDNFAIPAIRDYLSSVSD
jgi:hypothetical protein